MVVGGVMQGRSKVVVGMVLKLAAAAVRRIIHHHVLVVRRKAVMVR